MLFLNGGEIMRAITLDEVMEAVSDAYILFDKGTCYIPNRAFYAHEGNKMIYMPCFAPGALITKILSFFPENYKKGKPTIDGVVLWKDPDSGEILAIMDAKKITALRTAAAGGLAVRYLSNPGSRTLGIVGAGMQGLHLALFVSTVRSIEHIYLYYTYRGEADSFADGLKEMLGRSIPCTRCGDTSELLEKSEIVVTATTSAVPVLPNDPALLANKCFVGVGSYSPSMREYPGAIWSVADTVYVDLEYAMEESGDLSQPLKEGLLKPERVKKISSLIGGIVMPPAEGKSNFFKTVGMSLVDLTTAAVVYKNALEKGIGQAVQG
ncbi:MAG: ornithine cyclodeaminase family protein [Synergistaceae bacterium]|jgi:ornithine cyclodeaminase/alanine dehydrogenase-like protein (mu-crystallin family)|nr:ornithine cyclodeaminase family protein [Synergistaceae bacterium]